MGDNRFLIRGYEGGFDRPDRVFARLDQADGGRVFLEALDARWLEAHRTEDSFDAWRGAAPDAPIYVLEFDYQDYAGFADLPRPREETLDWSSFEGADPPWLQLELGVPGTAPGVLYPNLFGPGQPINAAPRGRVNPGLAARLDRQFSLDNHETDPATLLDVLANLDDGIEWVAIYDVGQGSAAGLIGKNGAPLAYFDMGGGVLANTTTFPVGLTNICFTQAPTFILSHWDWDHWSSGARFGAQGHTWIVPNQKLGAVHATFAASVASTGRLLVWPSICKSLKRGQLTLFKCTGTGRNHSGLAIEVTGPDGEPPILLTGDARYSIVNNAPQNIYTSVVAPHHGADMRNHQVPQCPRLLASRTAYSYGRGNSFGHPRIVTEQDHDAASWAHASQGHNLAIDRATANRGQTGLGHVGLNWSGRGPLPLLPCHWQSCALQLTQS